MKITLYNAISKDGFVATKDGKEDFIPDELWDLFINVCNQNDVLIWGKNTYAAFKKYDEELIEKFLSLPIQKVILTRDTDYIPDHPFTVIHSIEEVSNLEKERVLVCGSATLNDLFVDRKLVDQIIVNILPITLNDGIPQFLSHPEITLVSEKQYPKWTQRVYSAHHG
jgi:dihydrofolate reductase